MGEQSWWASGAQRPACWHRLWEHSQQLLLTQGNQAFWLAPSVTLGAVGALGLASKGHQFPSCFRVKVAGPVLEGSMELQVPVCARNTQAHTGLTAKPVPRNGAWNNVETSEAGDEEC
jgi:hypothetical protein